MKWEFTMRARTFVFALVCGTATAALAQDGGYVRFPSASPEACAMACAGDRMCASWSFGTSARSYGQSQTRAEGSGMCTFSGSSAVRNSPGIVSGLPRRETQSVSVPLMAAPPTQTNQTNQSYAPQGYRANNQSNSNASGWDVRPAPWLSNGGSVVQQNEPQSQSRGAPQVLRPVPPIPSPTPTAAPRIDYDPPVHQQPITQYAPPRMAPPAAPAPAPIYFPQRSAVPIPTVPTYVPPTIERSPSISAPPQQTAPFAIPAPPPGTRDVQGGDIAPPQAVAPARPRPARGLPKSRTSRAAATPATAPPAVPIASSAPEADSDGVSIPLPTRPLAAAAPTTTRPSRRPGPARGVPRSAATAARTAPLEETAIGAATGASPPRQETAARPAPGRGVPRTPVRDPSNPESFRGPDGMIDAAEMRRAQLNAARDQGTPAYSVQREWEAVAAEGQRAEAAGEVRVDPLAGTSPVPPPPETRAERRAREAEEAAATAEEARTNTRDGDTPEEAAPLSRATKKRGARGVPRTQAPRQTSANEATAPRRARASRRVPAQALDREPRLSGGPG
jgi:hypothetical protein